MRMMSMQSNKKGFSTRGRARVSIFGIAFLLPFFLLVGSAHASFDGTSVTATWEMWSGSSPGAGGSLLAVTDTEVFVASDSSSPDVLDFHDSPGTTTELWDIDLQGSSIVLTYTSIEAQDTDHQYMYMMPVGFHLSFTGLADIASVSVDTSFAPHGFDPLKVDFAASEIWVNLQGSMCHYHDMGGGMGGGMEGGMGGGMGGGMPDCHNMMSPTGYDNQISLTVNTVPEPSTALLTGLGLSVLSARRIRRRMA